MSGIGVSAYLPYLEAWGTTRSYHESEWPHAIRYSLHAYDYTMTTGEDTHLPTPMIPRS